MRRFGLLIPSSNVVLEPLIKQAWVGSTIHVSRLGVLDVKLNAASRAQFEQETQLTAAKLLCDAKVEAVVWGGTSASWLGLDHDIHFVDLMQQKTGVPTGSCVLEINRQLRALGAKRLGIVTPYTLDVAAQINRNYEAMGFQIATSVNDGGDLSNDFAGIPQDTIARMIRTAAAAGPDAIIIMCTNVAGAALAQSMSNEVGCPIIDSAAATLAAFEQFLSR
ncbi:Asp/Glu racemase [Thalassobium sp. R2A62]|jgi:maleate isomerase|nr:Asp/Glu racemase [Thalassobium sp. R2A62]MDG1338639.1 aspartate/glutamate racemase family protein [Paracoccaceae bacterium]MDG2453057.1 aspartate/glutamate racemase family protein [Paracoccaceae bacterium]